MCGIGGMFASTLSAPELKTKLEAMNAAQAHRGPDEDGIFIHEPLRAGLASRRLSILDLENGSQPMSNEDGSVFVVMNGEIYNHAELRSQLLKNGHRFNSVCDTEVAVHLYEELGVKCLERFNGMFALAILDTRNRKLVLARDGAGMKPLYFTQNGLGFSFASEVKALFAAGLAHPEPDPKSIDIYLALGYVPAPMSSFRGIEKLPPGKLPGHR